MKTRSLMLSLLVLLALALAAYGTALDNPLLFDDQMLLQGNRHLTWSRITSLFNSDYFNFFPDQWVSYRPVSTLSYILNRSIWGEDYRGWRSTYLLLHTVNAFLVLVLFRSFTGKAAASLAAACLFLLHPVHSEVLNQVSFNEEILMTGFLLISFLAFIGGRKKGGWLAGLGVVTGHALALFSKETALFFPLVLAIWNKTAGRSEEEVDGQERRWGWTVVGASALVSLLYALIRFLAVANPADPRRPAVSVGSLVAGSRGMLHIVQVYATRLVMPVDLVPIYYFPPVTWRHPGVIVGALLMAALVFVALVGLKWRKPAVAASATWSLTGMAILGYMLVFPTPSFAFDRYLYLPSVGFILLAGLAADHLIRRIPWRWASRACLALTLLCLVASSVVIQQRNRAWSGDLELWTDAVRKKPENHFARNHLGKALADAGKVDEAEIHYRKALEIWPQYAYAHNNLGNVLSQRGLLEEAGHHFREAQRNAPDFAEPWYNMGNVLYRRGEYGQAADHYRKALAIKPSLVEAHFNLATVLSGTGRDAEAAEHYRAVVGVKPGSALALFSTGRLHELRGEDKEALASFARALMLDPGLTIARVSLEKARRRINSGRLAP